MTSNLFFKIVNRAPEDALNQDILNCHRIQGAQYEDLSDEEFFPNRDADSDCESDYGDAAFIEDWKEYDWSESWQAMGMTEDKLKVIHWYILHLMCMVHPNKSPFLE